MTKTLKYNYFETRNLRCTFRFFASYLFILEFNHFVNIYWKIIYFLCTWFLQLQILNLKICIIVCEFCLWIYCLWILLYPWVLKVNERFLLDFYYLLQKKRKSFKNKIYIPHLKMILSNKNFSISFSNHKSKDFSVVYIAIILTIMKGCKLTYDTNLNRN